MYTLKILNMASDDSLLLQSGKELDKYIEQYPQVSIFQSLKAKQLQLTNDPNYQIQLKKAAIFSPDRKKLYQFIIQPQLAKQIEKVEQELESSETISKELEDKSNVVSTPTINEKIETEEKRFVSPLEKYTQEETKEPTETEIAQQQLEREILQHAVSSTIILDADDFIEENDSIETSIEEKSIEKTEISEQNLEEFNELSVLDWLKSAETIPKKIEVQKSTVDLVSTFIKKEPQHITSADDKKTFVDISRPKQEFFSPENMAKMSLMEDEDLVTETLAKIYADQGNLSKARKAYDKLSLKYPEKRDYFARLKKELDIKQ